jgi:hypothetical protein
LTASGWVGDRPLSSYNIEKLPVKEPNDKSEDSHRHNHFDALAAAGFAYLDCGH